MPPNLGISQKNFTMGQNQFKVFGDGLANATVTTLTTTATGLKWQNIQTPGHGQNHVNVKADLVATAAKRDPRETTGDLTVTVTDTGTNESSTIKIADLKYP